MLSKTPLIASYCCCNRQQRIVMIPVKTRRTMMKEKRNQTLLLMKEPSRMRFPSKYPKRRRDCMANTRIDDKIGELNFAGIRQNLRS